MKKCLLTSLFLILSILSFGQTDIEKLNKMQSTLDQIQNNLGAGENVDQREIQEEIAKLKKVSTTNDSLETIIELLRAEVLLYKSKLTFCEKITSENTSDSVLGKTVVTAKVLNQEGSFNFLNIKKGSYVILDSERELSKCEKFINLIKLKHPNIELIVVENHRKSWYHICVSKAFNKKTVGNEVAKYRVKGFNDSWHLTFE